MTLRKVRFGTTGMEITRVGFGAWAVGGRWQHGWGSQDDGDSVAAVRRALEHGVNWIDTAAVYGLGHSEEIVAKALDGLPESDRPYVFTKCGEVWDDQGRVSRVATPASIRREVEASLRRLRVERVDLYQVHQIPDAGGPVEEYWQTMLDLRAEGKVRAVGLSNHRVDRLEAAERAGHVDTLQPPFSAINRSFADEVAWCAAHDTGVIVYSPMQSGLLTGAFTAERAAALPADDWRRAAPDFTTGLAANLALADALRPVADRHGVTPGAVAVAWPLAWPGVTGAIVGARRPDQVDGWVTAGNLELTGEDLAEIRAAIDRTGAGTGPSAPQPLA
ncbi:aldo/keto reductase [Actinomadura kijaniata]|uniref:Aryl-alcohol dehydrogenase-like predicted oxidoreductase n=1 Tax=Actinomadura namibiensis TaxID=182080 RepID=A0A7W3QL15_ACTNM|nr:aldo/keto reductase [Actinomadura namibiensis]MBA8951104.1 aryl-alcohol dehydrogenase-like predicted oxidoreductase [Actinomadura namibiensis]